MPIGIKSSPSALRTRPGMAWLRPSILGGAQPFYPAFAGAISYPLYGSIRSTLRAALRGALSGSLPPTPPFLQIPPLAFPGLTPYITLAGQTKALVLSRRHAKEYIFPCFKAFHRRLLSFSGASGSTMKKNLV